MNQSPYQNGRKNIQYSSPTFQSSIFSQAEQSKSPNSAKPFTPPIVFHNNSNQQNYSKEPKSTQKDIIPPFAINIQEFQPKKHPQKRHLSQIQQSQEKKSHSSSCYVQNGQKQIPSNDLFETKNSPKNSQTKWECDSTTPLKEQLNLEERNFQWFKQSINKKIDHLRTSLSYEKEILNKENQWNPDTKLKPHLRQLTETYDQMDNNYDAEIKKMEKERKQVYWKEFEKVIQDQRNKSVHKKERTLRKRELMNDLVKIENEKRLLQNEYQVMQKKYLNKSLNMQTKSYDKFKKQQKQSELLIQVKGMEDVNKRKSQKLESDLQILNGRLLGTKRMIKPRAYDLFNYK